MVSIVNISLSSYVPNDCASYYIHENRGRYSLRWFHDSNRNGSAEILNSNDIRGLSHGTPVMYYDGVLTWETQEYYEDDETSVFYNQEFDDDYDDYVDD
jgi:hypothetical protein